MTEEAMMREKDLPPLASLSVQAAASYATAFPKFGQPREVAHFSRDTARLVHYDRRSLQKYAPPALPARLDIGFDTYLPKASRVDEPAPIGDVLGALDRARVPVPPGTIVTFRNNLNKIFLTPYNPRDDWEVGVEVRSQPNSSSAPCAAIG